MTAINALLTWDLSLYSQLLSVNQERNCKRFLDEIIQRNNGLAETFQNFFYVQGLFSKKTLELHYKVEICRAPLEAPRYTPAPLKYKRAKEIYENLIREVLI